jgi:hypothetical protein
MLFPHLRGLRVERAEDTGDAVVIRARCREAQARCPACGAVSSRVHGGYARVVADGAAGGRPVLFRMIEMRLGWVPPGPRGRWFAPGRSLDTGQHLPPPSGGPCSPASCIPPAGVHVTRRLRQFTHNHPSGLSLACVPRAKQGPLSLSPGFAPRGHPRRTPGREQSLRTRPGTTSPT